VTRYTDEEIERLLTDATSGPWHAHFSMHGDPSVHGKPDDQRGLSRIAAVMVAPLGYGKANCLLIAAAPELIRQLLDRARTAETDADQLAAELDHWGFGDMHYGPMPRAESIVQALAAHERAVNERNPQ